MTDSKITYIEDEVAADMRPTFTIVKIESKDEAVYRVELQVTGIKENVSVDVAPLKMDSAVEILTTLAYTAKDLAGLDGSILMGAEKPYFPTREDRQELFEEGETFTLI